MVNVFSSHNFYSRWVVQSHNSVLHRPKRNTISWWLKSFFVAGCRMNVIAVRSRRLLEYLRLRFFKFHFSKLRSLASTTYVSFNRSRQRNGQPSSTNLHSLNAAVQSTIFGHVSHVWEHIWSSTGKAADTQFAVSQNPTYRKLLSKRTEIDYSIFLPLSMNAWRNNSQEKQMVLQFSDSELSVF